MSLLLVTILPDRSIDESGTFALTGAANVAVALVASASGVFVLVDTAGVTVIVAAGEQGSFALVGSAGATIAFVVNTAGTFALAGSATEAVGDSIAELGAFALAASSGAAIAALIDAIATPALVSNSAGAVAISIDSTSAMPMRSVADVTTAPAATPPTFIDGGPFEVAVHPMPRKPRRIMARGVFAFESEIHLGRPDRDIAVDAVLGMAAIASIRVIPVPSALQIVADDDLEDAFAMLAAA